MTTFEWISTEMNDRSCCAHGCIQIRRNYFSTYSTKLIVLLRFSHSWKPKKAATVALATPLQKKKLIPLKKAALGRKALIGMERQTSKEWSDNRRCQKRSARSRPKNLSPKLSLIFRLAKWAQTSNCSNSGIVTAGSWNGDSVVLFTASDPPILRGGFQLFP